MYSLVHLPGARLHRDEHGKKLIDNKPIAFPHSWDDLIKTSETLEPDNTIALVHTGRSNIIAIDFDSELYDMAIELNNSLDKSMQCQYIAKSMDKEGGHLLYRYSDNYLTDYINKPNGRKFAKLDTLYGETLCFLATESNKTKTLIRYQEPLTEIPLAMQLLVINHYRQAEGAKSLAQQPTLNSSNIQGSKLGFLAEEALKTDNALIHLLSVITPRQWKDILEGNNDSTLPKNHPDRLPMAESAHMYIVSLSAVLMLDSSIDQETHAKLIKKINSMFSVPLDAPRLNTILKRDLNKSTFDKDWQSKSFIVMSKTSQPLEVFKYTAKGTNKFIVYNHVTNNILHYDNSASVLDYLKSISIARVDKNRLITSSSHITIIDRPDEPFGHNQANETFNLYKWTPEQEIFYNPEMHEKDYKLPSVTLKALESSMGAAQLYNRFLPFMRRKFMTHAHSPLFFVFYGVPHSFKSAVVNGVFKNLAHRRVTQPSLEVLTDKYNDFLVNKDFIVLDEIQHYMAHELSKLIKVVKEYTGSATIAGVRAMHTTQDNNTYQQEATFILTTNAATQLTTETADRRMVVFKSLRRVADVLGMNNTAIRKAIESETKDFAYYLSTQVESLYGDTYEENYEWQDDAYKLFQETALCVEDKLAKLIDINDYTEFLAILNEFGITNEMIAESCYTSPRKAGYILRLFNTRSDVATVKGIFDHSDLDYKKIKKKLDNIEHVTNSTTEYEPGTSNRTGSRKTEIVISKLPEEIAKLVVDERVTPIPEM